MDHEEYKRKALEPIVKYIESAMASYSKEELEARIKKALPEKESEDERIRTRLIALVEAFGQGKYKDEMLAYLEKQKDKVVKFDHDREQKHKIARWRSLGDCLDIPDGHYVVGWFRFGDFRLGIMCNGLFVDPNGNRAEQPKEVFYIPNADEEFIYAEQQPAEWSEEDENVIETLIRELRLNAQFEFAVRKLSLDYVQTLTALDKCRRLCPQPHWKPSKEQICELNWASKLSPVLDSLYNDLKSL